MESGFWKGSPIEGVLRHPAALAVALFLATEVELAALSDLDHRLVAVVMAPLITLPLAWRRRVPLIAAVVVTTAFTIQTALGVSDNAQVLPTLALLLASFFVGRFGTLRSAVGGFLVIAAIGAVAVAVSPDDSPSDYVFVVLLVASSLTAGVAVRLRTAEAATHAQRAALAEASSQERAREAIELERRRIARELHDVVAHAISLMVLQATAAEAILDTRPDEVRTSLRSIQGQGRAALADMHHLLGVLRRAADTDDLDPQPTLRDLPELARQFESSGLPVQLALDIPDGRLSPSVEVSIYRVVREALTNVLRHAGRATATVRVGVRAGAVEVEVRDDGSAGRPGSGGGPSGSGFGLVGMRERVALFGGELRAGPHPEGGFVVHASFPLDTTAAIP